MTSAATQPSGVGPVSDPVLTISGATVQFGGVRALAEVDITVERGSIHALIGPNGAGKSTCFNAITALYPLAAGQVHLDGTRLDTLPKRSVVRHGVARTFQNLVMPAHLTAAQTIAVGRHHLTRSGMLSAALRGPRSRREEAETVERTLAVADLLGLTAALDRPVGSLPYGDRKKVELARALVAEPQVLLLDEPVAGMNDAESAALGDRIRAARDAFDLTVVLVEHDMDLVMALSDRISVLQTGRLIGEGTPQEVQNDAAVIAAYLGEPAEQPLVPGGDDR